MVAAEALRLGTRGSRLALWQAEQAASALRTAWPDLAVETVVITTAGDRLLDKSPSAIGDKGLFTRELEDALAGGRIDLAVHSLKDLPTALPDGLALGALPEREDPRDALVAKPGTTLARLARGARVGTASLRRRAQLLALRPDLEIRELRGNVPTRVEKMERGEYDAVVLARAGLKRLGLDGRITELLEPEQVLPAAGQGALALQIRRGDARAERLVAPLDHRPTRLATAAERTFLARLEGGCQVPVGALAVFAGDALWLRGLVASLDGTRCVRGEERLPAPGEAVAESLGARLAERLLAEGADDVLSRARAVHQ